MGLNFLIPSAMLSCVKFPIVAAKSAKDTMKKFTSPGLHHMTGSFSFLVAGMMALLTMTANVSRAQTNFASAEVISGDWGVVTNDNVGVTADVGTPNIAGFAPKSPLWYQWTAPQDGVVTMDTIGSLDATSFEPLNTVLAVYTGTSLGNLNQVAANDNIFPVNDNVSTEGVLENEQPTTTQLNESGNADFFQFVDAQPGEIAIDSFAPPYYGPSGLRFNAVGGQTYYFAVDSELPSSSSPFSFSSGTGLISLNWAYQPSGVFRFASEDVDFLSGLLLYQTSQTESVPPEGPTIAGNSVILTYYNYNAQGVLVTVTRTAGSTGRAEVNYSTIDGTNLLVGPNDMPAFGEVTTNFVTVTNTAKGTITTNAVAVAPDYIPASGTLVFDDFEMSKTILIHLPVNYKQTPGDQTNRVFGVQLSSPVLDPGETSTVSQPRVDPTFGTAMVRILNDNADPYGPDMVQDVVTNTTSTATNISTNMVVAAFPTNVVFNFEKVDYRVPADVNNGNVSPWTQVTLWVERFGTNTSAVTLNYRVNNILGNDQDANEEQNIYFPLQPGSDYAVPSPATWSPIQGTNSDFDMTEGTISFPSSGSGFAFQPITFTVPTSTLTKFNKDFKVQIYHEVSINNQTVPELVGMVNEATVTILFDDQNPPAGSVDEFYNADFNSQLALYASQVPATTPPGDANPGVGINGEVYSLAMLTNDEALIGGDFQTYNGESYNNGEPLGGIALINTNGQWDTSFNAGSGADGAINAVALDGNQFYVGGSFTSFNSKSVGQGGGIVRLNANGSADNSFNPGLGPDAPVRAVAVLANGEVLIGGDFTHVNRTPCSYLALLNTSGGLDTSFNPGTNITGSVYALLLQGGKVLVGGNFGVGGETYQNIARLNLDGSVDTSFIPGTGADGVVHALAWQSTGQIIVGGEFTHFNGSALNRIAELNFDGSLDSTNFFVGSGADNTVFCLNDVTSYVTNATDDTVTTNISIYVGGAFDSINGTHRLGFARLYSNGTVDTTFMDTSYNQFAGLKRIYASDAPIVMTTALQTDGNVLIGGTFNQVGGGQANTNVCDMLDTERGIYPESFNDTNLWVEPKTRDGVRNRSGLARLIGGATPGPGNFGLNLSSYSADKSQSSIPNVSLVRTNGALGPVSANFSVQAGTANSGQDYAYYSAPPLDWVASQFLETPTRERSDGLYGQSDFLTDIYPAGSLTLDDAAINNLSLVSVSVINNQQKSGNLDAQFQLANPSMADTFYLGGEEIPVGSALGVSSAPLTLVDDTSAPGTFGFSSATYVATNLSVAISVLRSNGVYGVVTMKYSTTNGTALAGADYVGITNQPMDFGQGLTSNRFNITIKNDGYINNVEKTFNLSLFDLGTTAGAELGISNAVVRIINPNYQGYLTLGATNYTGTISSGVLNFVVNRISGSLGTATVQYGTTNGSAISGTDYIGATNTLIWNSGDVSPRVVSIPLINPNAVGTNKQFSVSLFNPTLNSTNAPSLMVGEITNATLVISNDNTYGTVQFSQPSYTVSEAGGYATITAIRTGGYVGTVSVNYATANGANTASGVNYSNTTGILVFGPDQTTASFTVPVINDGIIDPTNFYFNVFLSDPTNAVLGSLTNVQVNLLDVQTYNQPPGSADPTFATNGVNSDVFGLALETNGQILAVGSFTAVGSTPAGGIVRLNPDGSDDTTFLNALNGLSGANASVNTVACQTDGRVLVGGSFTTLNGVTRNFIGRLMTDGSVDTSFNPGSGADGPVYAIAETFIGGNREIYVGGTFGNINGVASQGLTRLNNGGTVDTSFVTGTALDGQAYAIAVYPTNSMNAGQVLIGGSFAHYNGVALNNFARLNSNGSVDTNFTSGFGLGPNATVSAITIQSDGRVLVGGDFTNFNGTPVNYIVRLNTDGSIDTNFTANIGIGANGPVQSIALQSDNRIVLGGQFTQFNGVTRNHVTRLLPTGAIDLTINFGDGANGDVDAVVIQPTNGMIVIGGSFSQYNDQSYDNIARIYGDSETGSGQFEFSTANYQVNEDGISAPITIRRTGGTSGPNPDGSGDVYVTFSTTNGTAIAGTNYDAVNESVAFPPGEVLETVAVPVINNQVIGPGLTVNLGLSDPTPPASLGFQPPATLTILNDNSAISFSSSLYTVDKNVPTRVAAIDIIRQGDINDTATVEFYTITNGTTAVPVTDYSPTNEIVTFAPGQSDVQVQVPINNNGLVEGNTTVGLVLTNASTSTVLNAGTTFLYAPSNAVLTIIDTTSSPGSLAFSSTNYVVNESAGTANLTVVRTNGSTGAVTISYSTYAPTNLSASATAQPGVNYVASTDGELTIGNGKTSGTITIPLIANSLVQPPVSFGVTLFNPASGELLVAPSNTTVTIISDNFGVDFASATNYVAETNSYGYVSVQRIGNNTTPFNVNYATVNGTALSGVNYQATSGTLSFGANQTFQTIAVPLINNHDTTNLMFGLVLSNSTAGAVVAAPSNTVVVIEPALAGLSFTNSTNSVSKNDDYALVAVVCSNPSIEPVPSTNTGPLTVNFATADGTAEAGVDYTATNGTLIFTNGLATNYFRVAIRNNSLVEGNRTFSVSLSDPTVPGKLAPPSTQLITIVDDNSGLSFSSPTYTVLKTGGATTITVLRTDYTNTTSSVSFETADGTAVAGQDYVATNGTFVFTNGQTAETFSVGIIGNSTVQPDKTVLLQLFNATNGFLVAPYAATLTIHDTSGSLVVPAGSVLVSGSTNGIIDPGATVSLLFGFRASGGTNVTDVSAALLQTNGIASPSGSQNYGTLIVNGPSVSREFTFTANGTNSQQIAATFQLQSAGNNIGTAIFTYSLGTWTTTFYNTNPIIINADNIASPYPSFITVTNVGGDIIKATATLTNIVNLASPQSMDVLLVSPAQQDTLLMANVGANNTLNKVTLTFDDASTNSLPENGQIVSGTNKPTVFMTVPPFP
jgi:uncharacterized delta-60 repeat protein